MQRLLLVLLIAAQPALADLIDIEPGPPGHVLIGATVTAPVQVRLHAPDDQAQDIRLHCERLQIPVTDGRHKWSAYWVPRYPMPGLNQHPQSGQFLIRNGHLIDPHRRER